MFREYRDCMFRSEWLKDAKLKSLVANDRTDRPDNRPAFGGTVPLFYQMSR